VAGVALGGVAVFNNQLFAEIHTCQISPLPQYMTVTTFVIACGDGQRGIDDVHFLTGSSCYSGAPFADDRACDAKALARVRFGHCPSGQCPFVLW